MTKKRLFTIFKRVMLCILICLFLFISLFNAIHAPKLTKEQQDAEDFQTRMRIIMSS